jgi:hypothetical protein
LGGDRLSNHQLATLRTWFVVILAGLLFLGKLFLQLRDGPVPELTCLGQVTFPLCDIEFFPGILKAGLNTLDPLKFFPGSNEMRTFELK